ncbi:hypothetical protein ANCDUO_24968 [Ancylostoma duodenale]|uniref:Neurotransmitter-gated ion-channel transmembrane domain-containing protein n=1 Tax=Ancylostoma duodenale TaxID=51022 RepID=A0A0C2BMH4_9BILA|nr:hypothetical protein ANCDUO_24968 [Ancylostoma duodenale]
MSPEDPELYVYSLHVVAVMTFSGCFVPDAYTTDQLQIEWVDETPITRNPHIAMSDMHIVDLFPGSCDGNYSTGAHTFPGLLIGLTSYRFNYGFMYPTYRFSFWLDVEAVPARVSLAITTLLTLSTQANAARMALPEVSVFEYKYTTREKLMID